MRFFGRRVSTFTTSWLADSRGAGTRDRPHGCAGVPLAALRDADGHHQVQSGFPAPGGGSAQAAADHRARCTTRRSSGRVPGRFRWPRRRYALLRPDRERRGSWRGSLRQPVARCEVESLLRSSCRGGCELPSRNGFPQVGDGTVLLLPTILLRMHLAAARCRVGLAGTGRADAGPGLAGRGCRGRRRRRRRRAGAAHAGPGAGRARLSGAASPVHRRNVASGLSGVPVWDQRRSVFRHGPSPAGGSRDAHRLCVMRCATRLANGRESPCRGESTS